MSPTESNKTPSTEVTTKFLATLNYYLEPEKGGSNTYFHGSGNDPELNQYDSAEVYIHNIRGREPDFRLDEHGFEVLQNVEIMRSSDPTYFENEYYAIIARTLMAKCVRKTTRDRSGCDFEYSTYTQGQSASP
ncbi:hypothetical protein AC578_8469 [Pseudocercospora eumusae]|uniref:Uncharacterized protein n=1 Tax=Pseudocercospora eumusae TaxID=321146 RepID=A0A139GXK4_9PEZI|nr:hypothetical protein AC578_8469 [Pseudocercospora eumusae]